MASPLQRDNAIASFLWINSEVVTAAKNNQPSFFVENNTFGSNCLGFEYLFSVELLHL